MYLTLRLYCILQQCIGSQCVVNMIAIATSHLVYICGHIFKDVLRSHHVQYVSYL